MQAVFKRETPKFDYIDDERFELTKEELDERIYKRWSDLKYNDAIRGFK